MLHACGGSGYKRDMELERYLRDAKAGWVMGPTNEVLRQFVGKAVLLGFEALDYWNQSYNRRAVENEVKKLDADGKRELAEKLMAEAAEMEAKAPARAPSAMTDLAGPDPGAASGGPFVETYLVRPGGATVFALAADERVTVVDSRGSQSAEVSVLGADGRDDAAAIGARADGPATVLRAALANRNGSLLAHELGSRGLDPAEAVAIRLFGEQSPAGSAQSFRADAGHGRRGRPRRTYRRRRAAALRAPRRGAPRDAASYAQQELPPPLAEPRLDFRVDAASALAYEVRAGEFIQVIDVEGKQCSDFLAFHHGKLESGQERGFDATTTRSLMGQAYPQPGPPGEVLRRRPGPAGRGRPRHRRPPRHLRPRLHGQVLRGQGLPRPCELQRELQRAGDAVRDRAADGLGGAQLLLQHGLRREQRPRHGRALVAAGRLRPPEGDERSRLRVLRLPRRHRPGERLADHAESTSACTRPTTRSRSRSRAA